MLQGEWRQRKIYCALIASFCFYPRCLYLIYFYFTFHPKKCKPTTPSPLLLNVSTDIYLYVLLSMFCLYYFYPKTVDYHPLSYSICPSLKSSPYLIICSVLITCINKTIVSVLQK